MRLVQLFFVLFALLPVATLAQSADASFHLASNQYIHEKMQQAKNTLDAALQRYPDDEKLRALRDKIKEDEKKQQEQQQKQDQQNKEQQDQQKQDQQKQDSEKKDEQQKKEDEQSEKEDKEKKEQEEKEKQDQQQQQDKKDEKKKNENLDRQKLEDMKISEEKARMILEAMKNQEKQYLQQNKRKTTQPKDRSKPDW